MRRAHDAGRIPAATWKPLECLPYRKDGRGPDAYDCLGVMCSVLREYLGTTAGLDVTTTPDSGGPWNCVALRDALRTPGAVALTRTGDGALHVWTVIGNGRLLTSMPERGVCTVSDRVLGRAEVVGCYVHREAGQ